MFFSANPNPLFLVAKIRTNCFDSPVVTEFYYLKRIRISKLWDTAKFVWCIAVYYCSCLHICPYPAHLKLL